MSRNTDPTDWEARFRALERKVRELARQSALASSSVTRGRVRIASAEGLVVEGSADITGLLKGSGTLTWTGPANLNGNTVIGGTLHVTSTVTLGGNTTINGVLVVDAATDLGGDTTISGTLTISGGVTLTGDLTVGGGGSITAGSLRIHPNGRIEALSGAIFLDGPLYVPNLNAIGDPGEKPSAVWQPLYYNVASGRVYRLS